jgi:microcystin-dependent protein
MGVVNTTYTFTSTDTITSAKMNNIIDDTTFTSDAIQGTTLQVVSPGKLAVSASGITSNELASNAVVTAKIADASVTLAKLAPESLFPSGAVMAFAMNSAPAGWLEANGGEYLKTGTYAALFAAIGITYGETNGSGGVGTSHFRVPDLRGYFVRGVGVAGQNGANGDGTVSGAFGVKQADEIKSHTHLYFSAFTPFSAPAVGGGSNQYFFSNQANTTGAAGGTETRPKNIAMLYCIKI